jgi:hypothetical protein
VYGIWSAKQGRLLLGWTEVDTVGVDSDEYKIVLNIKDYLTVAYNVLI